MNEFIQMELNFLGALQNLHNPILDKVMVLITHLGDAGIIWILLAVICLITPKNRRLGIFLTISLIIHLILINAMIKPIVARIRPYELVDGIDTLIKRPSDYSFPSGHTASSFACATVFFIEKNKYRILVLITSILIAFSRLYLFVHYPSDVIGGIMIGVLCSVLAYIIMCKVKILREKFPKTVIEEKK